MWFPYTWHVTGLSMNLQSPSFQNEALCKRKNALAKFIFFGRKHFSVSDVGAALGGSCTLLTRTCDPRTLETFCQPAINFQTHFGFTNNIKTEYCYRHAWLIYFSLSVDDKSLHTQLTLDIAHFTNFTEMVKSKVRQDILVGWFLCRFVIGGLE